MAAFENCDANSATSGSILNVKFRVESNVAGIDYNYWNDISEKIY